jgi:hypothetical protein
MYIEGHLNNMSLVSLLTKDLIWNWDDNNSVHKFPPAFKFFGMIDKGKNRHIFHGQIPLVPKIQLVLMIEEDIGNFTVDSS